MDSFEEKTINHNNISRTYIISKSFKEKWVNYAWQSLAAGLLTMAFLYVYNELVSLFIIAGVGSTFFAVFAMPGIRTSKTRNIVGSYIICVSIGIACFHLSSVVVSGGVAVGASAFFMVITDTEHPPAAGVALGLALTTVTQELYEGTLFAIIGALVAVVLKKAFKPWLKDLV